MRATQRKVLLVSLLVAISGGHAQAANNNAAAKEQLVQLLLGKEVQALLDLPATKEGIDIYFVPPEGKRIDKRGLDLGDLTKWLKGIGIEAHEWDLITNVKISNDKISNDKIELHIAHRRWRPGAKRQQAL